MIKRILFYRGGSYTWLGHAWTFGPPRWFAYSWKALPVLLLALILWRVWS